MNYRFFLNIITVCLLIYGIFEAKNFLNVNFVENDTKMKRKLNDAFNGRPVAPEPEAATIQLAPKTRPTTQQ